MTVLSQHQHNDSSPSQTDADRASEPEPSVGTLAAQLGEQVSRLVRDELALAQMEAKQKAKRIGAGAGMFGLAGGLAFFASCCFIAALVLGLSNVMRPWLAAVVAGGGLFLLAGLVALPGWKGITAKHPDIPHDSVQSVKADVAAVRAAVKR